MSSTISSSFQGAVKEFQESFKDLTTLLIIAILVIYIVLGILYESFIHPITILSGLPSAVVGALAGLLLFHKEHRIGPRKRALRIVGRMSSLAAEAPYRKVNRTIPLSRTTR
jgi:Cu/Ag efflux pump CusA